MPLYLPPVQALVVQQRKTAREATVYRLCQVIWTVSHSEAILAVKKGETTVCGSSTFCL